MKHRKTLLAASILAALCLGSTAYAQDTSANQDQSSQQSQNDSGDNDNGQNDNVTKLGTIEVTGIRASMRKSLQTKRNANAIIEAITAEDLGKFPNTNAAEALALIPGVQVDRQFGQGQRITIDGINSTLNVSLLDNHPVAQTSWRYFSSPQRGFNYLMLAPAILGRIEVFKSQQARLTSGSIGGTVIMHTRRPLDMEPNTVSGSLSYHYNDQAGEGSPTGSLLYSWHNDASTFGVNVALQRYQENIDRQGLEIFGYDPVSAYAAAGNTYAQEAIANGTVLASDMVPQEINAAWFQQELKRDSALVNVQFAPTDSFGGNLSLLYIKENFTNYNQSVYNYIAQNKLYPDKFVRNAQGIITDGHVTVPEGSNQGIIYDNQLRPSEITTQGADLKLHYFGDGWEVDGRVGYSKAENPNSGQIFIEPVFDGSYSWNIHTGFAPDDKAAYMDPSEWGTKTAWFGNYNIFGSSQEDTYAKLNFRKYFDGFVHTLRAGLVYKTAETAYNGRAYGGVAPGTLDEVGILGYTDILSQFPMVGWGSAHHPYIGADNVRDWVLNRSPDLNYPMAGPKGSNPAFYSQYTWKYEQDTQAAYIQADYATDVLRGNFGLRVVRTKNTGYGYNVPTGTTLTWDNLESFWVQSSGTNTEVLPSFTVIYNDGGDMVLRGSMAKVMAWAPYNTMAYQVALNDTTYRGTMGNPGLSPYIGYNTNVSAEWYFSPQAVIAVSAFYKNITNYIWQKEISSRQFNNVFNTDHDRYLDQILGTHGCDDSGYCDYLVKKFVGGGSAQAKGISIAYQQAFDNGFGFAGNYTYANGETNKGSPLAFLSRHTVSLSPYYEKGPFSARVNINSRSKYQGIGYVAGAATPSTEAFTTVSASIGWDFNKHWSLQVNGANLTNTKYVQYMVGAGGQQLPLNRYTTGRRFQVKLHGTF